jgi:hypothetical protein
MAGQQARGFFRQEVVAKSLSLRGGEGHWVTGCSDQKGRHCLIYDNY